MDLTLLAKDESSGVNGCPSVYSAADGSLVVQGPLLNPATEGNLQNPLPGEGAVHIDVGVVAAALRKLGR